jgi:hypothetical protein
MPSRTHRTDTPNVANTDLGQSTDEGATDHSSRARGALWTHVRLHRQRKNVARMTGPREGEQNTPDVEEVPSETSPSAAPAQASSAQPGDIVVLESCHSTWLFNTATKRFKRLLKGLDLDPLLAMTCWRSYERLELAEDSKAFVVLLDPAGRRQICSWRHVEGCEQCDEDNTVELSLEEVHRLARMTPASEVEPPTRNIHACTTTRNGSAPSSKMGPGRRRPVA